MSASASGEKTVRATDWAGKPRGGVFGNWFFLQLIQHIGLGIAYVWLVPVAAYFVIASPRGAKASIEYFTRLLGRQPFWRLPLLVYRHFYSFGVTLLDRSAVIMGRGRGRVHCTFEGEDLLIAALARGRGIILLGAHVGSWEVGGQLLARLGRPVNLVVVEKEANRVSRLFDQALEGKTFRLLTTSTSPIRSVPVVAALRRGEIVAVHGDRHFGGASMPASFLGAPASFPIGPYILAAVSGAPVFQCTVVRQRRGEYRFFFFPEQNVAWPGRRPDRAVLQACVDGFATRMESVVRDYPFQWYNFYPFWAPVPEPEQGASRTRMARTDDEEARTRVKRRPDDDK